MKKLQKLQLNGCVQLKEKEMKEVKGGYAGICYLYCTPEDPIMVSECSSYLLNKGCGGGPAIYGCNCTA